MTKISYHANAPVWSLGNPLLRGTATFLLSSALLLSGTEAYTTLNPGKVIEFSISKSGLTRISIDNDSIEDVYAYPAEPDLITHHKSGHVFVTPDDLDVPVYVTVITRSGLAQDMRLAPVSKKPEPILLHAPEAPKAAPASSGVPPQEAYAQTLKQFVQGTIPAGFIPVNVPEVSRGRGPVEAVLEKAYQNGALRVLVFALSNTEAERRALDNREFWAKGDAASAFDKPALGPEETARLFVIQQL